MVGGAVCGGAVGAGAAVVVGAAVVAGTVVGAAVVGVAVVGAAVLLDARARVEGMVLPPTAASDSVDGPPRVKKPTTTKAKAAMTGTACTAWGLKRLIGQAPFCPLTPPIINGRG